MAIMQMVARVTKEFAEALDKDRLVKEVPSLIVLLDSFASSYRTTRLLLGKEEVARLRRLALEEVQRRYP